MRCYNKVNGKRCFNCCWGDPNNIFYYVYVLYIKIFG